VKTHGYKAAYPAPFDFQKAFHLADDKTFRLQIRPAISEIIAKRMTKVDHKLHAGVGQNPLTCPLMVSVFVFERPSRLHKRA
jgi:hypothetical protein